MCDYSLMHLKSRPAKVGDKLTSGKIRDDWHYSSTKGLFDKADPTVAVCLIPGTEVAFDRAPVLFFGIKIGRKPAVATFCQINKDQARKHHDALRFADDEIRLIHDLADGQEMTVLQLPAAPKTAKEAEDQQRVATV